MESVPYRETLDFLFSQLPMFQRIGAAAFRKDLTNIRALCQALGNPQDRYPVIHVAGTNGKGSTCFMLSAVLQAAGWKTGLCVSPHYRDFRERVRINGIYVPKRYVVDFVERIRPVIEAIKPSFFEMSTALAFDYFAAMKVDVAIVETGLGGRLDSTNIVHPELSVITNIGFDHMEFLGDTLPLIAAEKAGIIKAGAPVVIGESQPETGGVFTARADEIHTSIVFADQVWKAVPVESGETHTVYDVYKYGILKYHRMQVDLAGGFQSRNLQTSLQALAVLADRFHIREDHIRTGLAELRTLTGFIGRWDIISRDPVIICDSAHNAPGIESVMEELKKMPFRQLHIVLGMVRDKDTGAILSLLPQDARYYFCKADIPRGLDAAQLKSKAQEFGLYGRAYISVKNALRAAKRHASANDLIFVGGSIFVVGEVI